MSPSVETSAPAGNVRPSMNEALTLLVREGIGDALRPFARDEHHSRESAVTFPVATWSAANRPVVPWRM